MSWFDSDVLEFNTETLTTQATAINRIADDLEKEQADLRSAIVQLRDDWKTGAGAEFFEKYDEDWTKILDNHIKLLRDLVDALDYAAAHYEPVADEYGRLMLG